MKNNDQINQSYNWLFTKTTEVFAKHDENDKISLEIKNKLFQAKTKALLKYDTLNQPTLPKLLQQIDDMFYVPQLSFAKASSYLFITIFTVFLSVSIITPKDSSSESASVKSPPINTCFFG
ncbi:MAG: hypothetical protein DRQ51_02570 [Gammaproteobacteria bacterium]|nr:MAG: hypothetical protein DRQ51_02570 [Gammaproteobacteria bacterium]